MHSMRSIGYKLNFCGSSLNMLNRQNFKYVDMKLSIYNLNQMKNM